MNMQPSKKEIEKSWISFMEYLKGNLPESEFEAWAINLKLDDFSKSEIALGGLNRFFCDWIKEQRKDFIKNSLFRFFNKHGLNEQFELLLNIEKKSSFLHSDSAETKKVSDNGLTKANNFENFVNGSNTDIAYATAVSISENPEKSKYNPFFLCGDVGLGKTHLMQAIGLKINQNYPDKNILYCTSEDFTNEVIEGIRFSKIQSVREKYRKLDLLMIDDIQFLENKESTQNEFFHTFNELIRSSKQIIITADRYPGEIKKIEERLISRFNSGMVAKIEPPDYETRIAIIESILHQMNFELSKELILHIAHAVKSDIRKIRGILTALEAESSMYQQETVDLDFVRSHLKDVLNLDKSPKSIDEIVKAVAQRTKVKVSEIMSESREREISNVRQICMYVTKEVTDLSYPAIGKYFDKSHSTIIQACKKVKNVIDENAETRQLVLSLIREISS